MTTFSALHRQRHLQRLGSEHFELLVIGGGITGAGILLDAASRGIKAALVEKNDFAWGTSSRSTKLIHGGLRYLKQMELSLVREVGKERSVVYRNARHIVRPEKILLPFYRDGSMGKLMGSLGLWIYDRVANVDRTERRKVLTREEAIELEPLLKKEGLTGAGLYYEYRTDDARLTIEVLKTAAGHDALPVNYVKADSFEFEEQEIKKVNCLDMLTGEPLSISADAVVNAAGPWADSIRALDSAKFRKKLFLTSGVHIVVAKDKFPVAQSLYFESTRDGRMIFCISRGDFVYIGTTDEPFAGDIDQPPVENRDIAYLLEAIADRFEGVKLAKDDIVSTWSGLRPLIYQEGKAPSELSRKDEIFFSPSGLITIAGGKLTGYRKMAERVVDLVADVLPSDYKPCQTRELKLSGSPFKNEKEMRRSYEKLLDKATRSGVGEGLVAKWWSHYGHNAGEIVNNTISHLSDDIPVDEAVVLAEIDYAIGHEMVLFPEDFFNRRTSMIHFDRDRMHAMLPVVERYLQAQLSPKRV